VNRLAEIGGDDAWAVDVTASLDVAALEKVWLQAAGAASEAERVVHGMRDEYQRVLKETREREQALRALPATCATCAAMGRTCELTPDAKEKAVASLRATANAMLDDLKREGVAAKRVADERTVLSERARVQLERAREAEGPRRVAAVRQKALAEERARLEAELETYPQGAVPDPSCLDRYTAVTAELAFAEGLNAQAAAHQAEIAMRSAKLRSEAEVGALAALVACFAKDGIPLWLARQHVVRINALAAEIAAEDRYRYSFDAEMGIVFTDAATGVAHGPDVASGSTRVRGSVVLLAAMARYMQEQAGVVVPLLWIDELPFQDDLSVAMVVQMLKRLTRWFPKVVFAASSWEAYLGHFDHEVGLVPESVAAALEGASAARVEHAADGQGMLGAPAPVVRRYPHSYDDDDRPAV